jgi:hypothetical protein
VQNKTQFFPVEDEDVASEMASILREDSVDILLSAEPVSAALEDDARLQVATPEETRSSPPRHWSPPDAFRIRTGSISSPPESNAIGKAISS